MSLHSTGGYTITDEIDGLVQDCSIYSVSAMEILQSYTKALTIFFMKYNETCLMNLEKSY